MAYPVRNLLAGLLFSLLWSSAAVAGKIGLESADGLTLFTVRFLVAGAMLLAWTLIIRRERWPAGTEWCQLLTFGLLNTTVYLGIFIVALEEVAAGITSIALALNPLMMGLMTAAWLRRPVRTVEWISIVIGMAGVGIACYPLLQNGTSTLMGVILLGSCMIAYSLAGVYYARVDWKLSNASVNGWQVMLGGLLLLPFAYFFQNKSNHFDSRFWTSIAWLVIPVSIGAVQLWLYLLKIDTVKASLWLFLCPIFGLAYASIVLDESFTVFTAVGTILVLLAQYLGQRYKPALRES